MKIIGLICVSLIVVCAGCGGGSEEKEAEQGAHYQLESTKLKSDAIRCERHGGGDVVYTVKRAANGEELEFFVERYNFSSVSFKFVLSSKELGADAWQMFQKLFDGEVDIGGDVYAGAQPTGSWFYGYSIFNGGLIRIANAEVIKGLESVQPVVESEVSSRLQ